MNTIHSTKGGQKLSSYEYDLQERLEAGFILLDKQPGPTSHQLAAWIRELLELPRLAHGGTLDPFASGVLPLLLGRAMKLTPIILSHSKSYVALFRFSESVNRNEMESQLRTLVGRIYNVPPEISAVKVQVRTRKIENIELLEHKERYALVKIICEAGTYIRTFARDLGLLLDLDCDLVELRRTRSGQFDESHCVSMEQLADAIWKWKELGNPRAMKILIFPIEEMLEGMPKIYVRDNTTSSIGNGMVLNRPGLMEFDKSFSRGDKILLVDRKGKGIGIAEALIDSDSIQGTESGPVAQPRQQLRG